MQLGSLILTVKASSPSPQESEEAHVLPLSPITQIILNDNVLGCKGETIVSFYIKSYFCKSSFKVAPFCEQ